MSTDMILGIWTQFASEFWFITYLSDATNLAKQNLKIQTGETSSFSLQCTQKDFFSFDLRRLSSPFCGPIDTPVLDFCWRLPWVSKPWGIPSLACFVACTQWIKQNNKLVTVIFSLRYDVHTDKPIVYRFPDRSISRNCFDLLNNGQFLILSQPSDGKWVLLSA